MIVFKNLLLALVWTMLTGNMSFSNLLVGLLLGHLVLRLQYAGLAHPEHPQRLRKIILFLFYFAWEVLSASIRVAHDVVTPTLHARPGIIAVPLDAKTDLEITLLSNALTLTPGSVSLDISEDRKTLYLHVLFADDPDEVRRRIKEGMERRLLEVLR